MTSTDYTLLALLLALFIIFGYLNLIERRR